MASFLYLCALTMLLSLTTLCDGGKVLLVSMDGFRWDYMRTVSGLDAFQRLAMEGVEVDYVDNGFPTVTFPSHYTIVTGVYAETHGVVANNMYDPDTDMVFQLTNTGPSSTDSTWWNGTEPVWVTAVKHGLQAGVIQWPGCAAEIGGYRPTDWRRYEYGGNMTYTERVTLALNWLHVRHMDLVAVYFDEPDTTGHKYGPDSQEVAGKVREMDGVLGLILDGLDARNLSDVVNVIVTSDHGMASIDLQDKIIDLFSVVDRSLIARVPDSGPVTAILPVAGREDEVMTALRAVDHATAYRKEDLPGRFHYKDHRRIMPVIVVADEGWILTPDVEGFRLWGAKGDHGFDNQLPSMKPIFFARGPRFHKGAHSTSIRSVDIYPLVCELLGLDPLPNNGSLSNTAQFLKQHEAGSASRSALVTSYFVCVATLAFTFCTV